MRNYAAAALCATLLAGCGIAPTTNPDGSVHFPERSASYVKEGTFVNIENLKLVKPGLTKDQIYKLIDEPQFDEGAFAVHVWNYIFDFRLPDDSVLTCQYQIRYDDNYKVEATYWKERECDDFINAKPVGVAPVLVSAPAPSKLSPPKRFTLKSEVLFAFDKSSMQDIRPEGRRELNDLAASLLQEYKTLKSVRIEGYTDRFGTAQYNIQLSQARARTIRTYLVQQGIPADVVSAIGMGEANPVTHGCPTVQSAAAIQCMAPDRRVEIVVNGQTKTA